MDELKWYFKTLSNFLFLPLAVSIGFLTVYLLEKAFPAAGTFSSTAIYLLFFGMPSVVLLSIFGFLTQDLYGVFFYIFGLIFYSAVSFGLIFLIDKYTATSKARNIYKALIFLIPVIFALILTLVSVFSN